MDLRTIYRIVLIGFGLLPVSTSAFVIGQTQEINTTPQQRQAPTTTSNSSTTTNSYTFDQGFNEGFDQGYSSGIAAGVAQCLENPQSCGLSDHASPSTNSTTTPHYGENEFNDSIVTATPLVLNQPFTGQSYDALDQDWFFVITPEQNYTLTINFSLADLTNAAGYINGWTITVRNAVGAIFAQYDTNYTAVTNTETGFDYSVTLGLAGTYYIVVEPSEPALWNQQRYRLKATLAQAANTNVNYPVGAYDAETEPNNTPFDADRVAIGVTMFGLTNLTFTDLGIRDDNIIWWQSEYDWYRYDSPGSEIVELTFCDHAPCTTGNWTVQFFSQASVDGVDVEPETFLDGQFIDPYDGAAWVAFTATSCGNGPCDCEQDCEPVPTVWRIGIEDPGTYYIRVNTERGIAAPCTRYQADTDNDGQYDTYCSCENSLTDFYCDFEVPNPNPLVAIDVTEYAVCANGTGGGDSSVCSVQCLSTGAQDSGACRCPNDSYPCTLTGGSCLAIQGVQDSNNNGVIDQQETNSSCSCTMNYPCDVLDGAGQPIVLNDDDDPLQCLASTGRYDSDGNGIADPISTNGTVTVGMDTDGDGLIDGGTCGCANDAFPCTVTIPNPNQVTDQVFAFPSCPTGASAADDNSTCTAACVCTQNGSFHITPTLDGNELGVYTSQYNFTWMTRPTGSSTVAEPEGTVDSDAYQDYQNRPSSY
jgi:hypothetical protein